MNGHVEALERQLSRLAELLHKYGHGGQASIVDQILATLGTPVEAEITKLGGRIPT
jgi:hypothetical protein